MSVVIARDTGGYLSGLTRWRRGDVAGWVAWVADAVTRSAEQVADLVASAEELSRRWEAQLAVVRSDAAARGLVALLPQHLVVTAPMVAELLGVSGPTARAAVQALAARGILQALVLRPIRPGRPAQWWMAVEQVSWSGGGRVLVALRLSRRRGVRPALSASSWTDRPTGPNGGCPDPRSAPRRWP